MEKFDDDDDDDYDHDNDHKNIANKTPPLDTYPHKSTLTLGFTNTTFG